MFAVRGRRLVLLAAIASTLLILLVVQQGPRASYIDRAVHNDKDGERKKELPQVQVPIRAHMDVSAHPRPLPCARDGDTAACFLVEQPQEGRPRAVQHQLRPSHLHRLHPDLARPPGPSSSNIATGWPPEQIYVVENTGVQRANARGKLTRRTPTT
ncbi:hypothetical protein TOPH_06234 [Tolypocladium ophioglossoides CBS 100239]|uniref:Uncharacterized protein n=1 Tax=Tolypocladium ophioglossoides (strain CBS 100239) TaxID=1163406 RepID=A0A0L0N4J5_TOLOC|nr:hypothetical protein TOPH_06234 [Tolypocladium ophioglossoides CBS 100239]